MNAPEGLEELLRLWVSTPSLPRHQPVRSWSSHAASETTQPTGLSTAGRSQLLLANPAIWAGGLVKAGSRATACVCLRRDVFRRAGCREIRLSGSTRGEWVALARCRPLSYSTVHPWPNVFFSN